jgi:hypothetical protein
MRHGGLGRTRPLAAFGTGLAASEIGSPQVKIQRPINQLREACSTPAILGQQGRANDTPWGLCRFLP